LGGKRKGKETQTKKNGRMKIYEESDTPVTKKPGRAVWVKGSESRPRTKGEGMKKTPAKPLKSDSEEKKKAGNNY